METKITKGQWQIENVNARKSFTTLKVSNTNIIADIQFHEMPIEQMQANAKIIASAPEMLDALLTIKEGLDKLIPPSLRDANKGYMIMIAAIKKATGNEY